MVIPHSVPSTSAALTTSGAWRDSPGQNGSRATPTYSYQPFVSLLIEHSNFYLQNAAQPYIQQAMPLGHGYMWNVQMQPQQGNTFNPPFIGGNVQAYRNGPFPGFYHHPADQQNRPQHYLQQQAPVQAQTLADVSLLYF